MFFSEEKIQQVAEKRMLSETLKSKGHEGIRNSFRLDSEDGVLLLLLLCFLCFARIYKGGFSFFKENINLMFSSRQNANMFSETTATEFWINFILIFQTTLLASIVVFDFLLESGKYGIQEHSFIAIILFMLVISAFLLLKYVFYRFLGYLFDIKEYVRIWLRSYMIILEMLGVIAFIPTLMLVYAQSLHSELLIFFFGLFLLGKLILFYRLIVFFLRQHVNFLFLIVYLCNVEIIPNLILYQVLVYLYQVDLTTSLLWL